MCRMLRSMIVVVGVLALMAADQPVGPRLQRMSVNIVASTSYSGRQVQGSGTLVICEAAGHKTTWVLTAHHVVKDLREVKTVIGSDGEERKQVRYKDAQVVQEQVAGGRGVGDISYDARVVSVDPRRDVALLRVRKDDLGGDVLGAVFYLDEAIPAPGTRLYHCGAPGGKEIGGTCSLTDGIVSRIGVRIPEFGGSEHGIFDQITTPSIGGSSGGLVALWEDGRWVGMITLGLKGADSLAWMVPVRSVRAWADEANVMWLLDPKAPRPTQEELDKIPLELNPAGFAAETRQPTPAPVKSDIAPAVRIGIPTETAERR